MNLFNNILGYIPRWLKPAYYLGPTVAGWMLPSLKYNNNIQREVDGQIRDGYTDYNGEFYLKQKPTQQDNVSMQNQFIESTGGAQLDTAEFEYKRGSSISPQEQRVIIFAVGRSGVYENHIKDYISAAKRFKNAKIVAFNFRGVMASTGIPACEQDWFDDCKAIIKHYQNLGVPLNQIEVTGHSMGGAITINAQYQKYVEDVNEAIRLGKDASSVKFTPHLNNRSYSTMARELTYSFGKGIGSGIVGGIIYGGLAWLGGASSLLAFGVAATVLAAGIFTKKVAQELVIPWVDLTCWALFGRLNAITPYQNYPKQGKDHIVAKGDSIIVEESGIHYWLKEERSKQKQALRQEIAALEQTPVITRSITVKIESLKNELREIKDSKLKLCPEFETADEYCTGYRAHARPLWDLTTYHKMRDTDQQKNGEQVLFDKIDKLFEKNKNATSNCR